MTGAGGFLGLYLVEQLVAEGIRVRAFARRRYAALEELGVEQVVGDLRDAEAVAAACQQMDVVFHAGGVAGIWGAWKRYYQINTVGTQHVVAGCRRHRVARLIYTSSPSVTFDGRDQRGIDESAPYARRWLCNYSRSKALAEQYVLAADESGGLRTCALRPHLIWGPRDAHLIPRLIERARAGRLRQVGDGANLVDMVYVENAARAHVQAAQVLHDDSPVCGRAYFISQGKPVNCWQWINEILAVAGLAPVDRSISLATAWRLGACMEAAYWVLRRHSEPPITRFLAAQLGRSHYFDTSQARKDFGYRTQISTEEGMRRLAASLK